jgi:hypothetical protein
MRTLISVLVCALLLQATFIIPASGRSPNNSNFERREYVANTMTDEEFRREMLDYLSELAVVLDRLNSIPAVHQKLSQSDLRSTELLQAAKVGLASASPADLAQMQSVYAKFPGWRDAPSKLNSVVDAAASRQRAASFAGGPIANITPDNCADGINAGITNTDISIAEAVVIAAEAVMEGFPTDGLTILARLAPIAVVAATQAIALSFVTLKAIADDCTALDATAVSDIVNNAKTEIINNDNANLNTILSNDDTNTTSITTLITNAKTEVINNDNTNRTLIISNDNANTATLNTAITNASTQIINNNNANTALLNTALTNAKNEIIANDNANKNELRDLILRTQIEADLAEADNATYVALYITPTSAGGHLDFVRSIVVETIAKLAGSKTENANGFLDAGDAAKNAGDYKSAYSYYRKAYKAAVK